MSREWKPGDVAMVTYRLGQCTESNLCAKTDKGWDCLAPGVGFLMLGDVIDARPLVVIDPEDRDELAELVERLYRSSGAGSTIDNWQAALREFANPTPPKPDEPTGLGAVVEDAEGNVWIRAARINHGWHKPMNHWAKYADIDAVRVLSEGVTP